MRLVHFAVDEKFIPFIQKSFEDAFPGANEYRLLGDPLQPLRFVVPGNNVKTKGPSYWVSDELASDLANFDCLVVHYMTPQFMEGISRASSKMLVVWVGWGGDYYYLIKPYFGELLLDKTRRLVNSKNKIYDWIQKTIIKRTILYLRMLVNNPWGAIAKTKEFLSRKSTKISIHDVIDKVDLLWVNPEEVPMIEKALPRFKGVYHRICCYSAEDTFAIGPDWMQGPDILIGNSATETNNHLELFDYLRELDLGGRRLIAPLSYGNAWYRDEIIRLGKKLFGNRFVPLRSYLPLQEYYEHIATCGTVVMNHVRQQGGTTIAAALYKGAKVFLRKESPVLDFYRNMGITLFTIQDDLLRKRNIFDPLSSDDMTRHRSILSGYWSYEAAVASALKLKFYCEKKRTDRV